MPESMVHSKPLVVLEKQRIALLHFVFRTKAQKDLRNAKMQKKITPAKLRVVTSRAIRLRSPESTDPCNNVYIKCIYISCCSSRIVVVIIKWRVRTKKEEEKKE